MVRVRTLPWGVTSVLSASTMVAHFRIPEKSPITAQAASAASGTSSRTVISCMKSSQCFGGLQHIRLRTGSV